METKLSRKDLFSLEDYAEIRAEFRARVMAHKNDRMVGLGEHATLYFEDRLTIQYQIQEMLRIEKIFDASGIQEELDAYNPLIPDGRNFKATFMIEYPEVEQRQNALARLIGIEDQVWVRAQGTEKIYAIADEDLDRANKEKTSAVHFLRFQLSEETATVILQGAEFGFGIDHPEYNVESQPLSQRIRQALISDLST